MARPVTLFTIQWGDLPLEEICALAQKMGYEGLELSAAHLDMKRAASDPAYVQEVKDTLARYGLGCWSISNHLAGQCVCDTLPGAYDSRLDGFAPAELAGKPEAIQAWAIEAMKDTARAAKAMGVDVVTFFMGSPIWKFWYSFPQTSEAQVEAGYQQVKALWSPIMDEFDRCGVKLALEIHPTEIAFDYWSTKKLLDTFDRRPTLGINFDPSHLVWQGLDPQMFLLDFADRIYHVHVKDVKLNLNGFLRHKFGFGSHSRFPHYLRRSAPGLELRLPRPRRCGFRQHHPGPQSDWLYRPSVHRVGGQRHGAGIRRHGGLCLHQEDQLLRFGCGL